MGAGIPEQPVPGATIGGAEETGSAGQKGQATTLRIQRAGSGGGGQGGRSQGESVLTMEDLGMA